MNRFRRLAPYVLRQRRLLMLIGLLSLLAPLLAALAPLPLQYLVDHAIARKSALQIVTAVCFSLTVFALGAVLEATSTFAWTLAGQRMVIDLGGDLFARLQRLSPIFHSRHSPGDLLVRLGGDTYCVYNVAETLFVTPVQHVLTLLLIAVVAWRLDARLTVISLALAPVMAASVYWLGPILKRRAKQQRVNDSSLVSLVHQTLGSIPLVQAYSSGKRNVEQYRALADHGVALRQKTSLINNASSVISGTIATLGTSIIVYLGATQVMKGAMTVGALLVFIAYLRSLQGAYHGLLSLRNRFKTAEAAVDRVWEIMDAPQRVIEEREATAFLTPAESRAIAIELDRVSFGYDPQTPVLRDCSLRIGAGERVALVGSTGVGKSTLIGLICRLFDPDQGVIRLAGQDVARLTLESVRRQIALVPQEPLLLPVSIRENIAWGRPEATEDEIHEAARVAGADGFITALPLGYDTIIGERGMTLSGGQRQRLSIARAVLKDAPAIILDEPTASLDATTEAAVMSAILNALQGRTCLVIAHRLSTIRDMDRIIVLDEGRIIEQGSHDELLRAGGRYWQMHDSQLSPVGGMR